MKQVTIPVYEYTELTQSARDKAYWPLAEELMALEYNELEAVYKDVLEEIGKIAHWDYEEDHDVVRYTDFVKIADKIGIWCAYNIIEGVIKKQFFLEIDWYDLDRLVKEVYDELVEEAANRDYTEEVIDHCQANDLLFYEDGSPYVPKQEASCTQA